MTRKHIVLVVSGGIACFKACQLCSDLAKQYDVQVVLTEHATKFVQPLTFATLTRRACFVDMFAQDADYTQVQHIELARWADLMVVVPATANILAKMAHGLADDFASTLLLASRSPILVCPAMNSYMLDNPATQANLAILAERGVHIMQSAQGMLACGDVGRGKLPDLALIEQEIIRLVNNEPMFQPVQPVTIGDKNITSIETAEQGKADKTTVASFATGASSVSENTTETAILPDLTGVNVLITAGPTVESIDPVRYITNHSSGKMGYALAQVARSMGANVTLISGPTHLQAPQGVKLVPVQSALQMFEAVQNIWPSQHMLIKAAAVADYRVEHVAQQKIKKSDAILHLDLVKNPDILQWVGEHKQPKQVVCGFAMETEHLLERAHDKLVRKHCDLLVANDLTTVGAGFAGNTNVATLVWCNRHECLDLMTKNELAERIITACFAIYQTRTHA